ncbi:hypothetical protein EGC79_12400 [Shewanella vesiculosa]|uniref:PIN domain-containing protein n=1 Tax=Shewanella vesiculosa TaxID=518738 RepID=UPI000F4F4216|nr:hypothetical protein [Shewanella vesiculosa]RPA46445.1 hypothetical protein EGC79_12400 [Shewanella vesiculosa]UJL42783.1 hypothetical protein KDH10_004051 [Shewanella vesiculosa]
MLVLINLLNITHFFNRRLIELGAEYINEIRKIDPKISDKINQITSKTSLQNTKFELVESILDLDSCLNLDAAIRENKISSYTINKWFDDGGQVQTGKDYFDLFIELNLKAKICDKENKKLVAGVEELAKYFLKNHANRLNEINPLIIKDLSDNLVELDLSLCAVAFLGTILPNSPWVSPMLECYLNALLASEKYEQLKNQLNNISFEDKNSSVWLIEAQLYHRLQNYKESILAAKNSIDLNVNNVYSWFFLLYVSRLNGTSVDILKKVVLEDIPNIIFETYCISKLPLVNEISSHIDPYIAERILVDWFVQNPEELAIPLTQIHFNSLLNRAEISNNPYVPNHCCDGVVYSDGFTTRKKILVRNISSCHSTLLDVESPLGQTLENMAVGDTVRETRLIERLPSYVAAFRHAIKLRDMKNDGRDVFRLLTLPVNEEEFIPHLENLLKQFSSSDRSHNKVLQNINIPLVMRGNYTNPNEPLKGAVAHLTSHESTRYLQLFNAGIENPHRVIIDVYTAVYFALIGVASTLSNSPMKIVLTEQSKLCIEAWISDVSREDYLSLDYTNNGIRRYTSEDIKRNSSFFINELKALVQAAEIEALTPMDTPDELINIRDVIDQSVYTTYQLSVANKIPWLCVDHHMSRLSHTSENLVANTNKITTNLLMNTPLKNKKQGIYLNLISGTPVSIMYDDILELSRSSSSSDEFLVHKFMEKFYIEAALFNSSDIALSFLTEVIGRVTVNAYINGQILRGVRAQNPAYDGYAEHIFNHCCLVAIKCLKGETAEFRFGLYIFNILNSFGRGISTYRSLILNLASLFATGHFLDINEVNRVVKNLCNVPDTP